MAWQYHEFIRIACVGATRAAALEALRRRVDKLRLEGWLVPNDSVVSIRSAEGIATASLTLPERCRIEGGFVLKRYVPGPRKERTMSGLQPRYAIDDEDTLDETVETA